MGGSRWGPLPCESAVAAAAVAAVAMIVVAAVAVVESVARKRGLASGLLFFLSEMSVSSH